MRLLPGLAMPPLFIPLKREFYEAFRRGDKIWEYRRAGGPWNPRTCPPGRRVVLSLGYGKAHRTPGFIFATKESMEPVRTAAWRACYGANKGPAFCIGIIPSLKEMS